ncbi:suppressor of fused domain protein [Sciscionella sediminilitoris]|uniref:suppressor of fused domain protein n=1 Tax=Sciscionella sediminilitoris TaxID=1445613 RepID=UPI0004DEFC28|nr:suppressor of fused domain protein [Sciscionella sp. SE31]
MSTQDIDNHMTQYLGEPTVVDAVGPVNIWRHDRPEFVSFATHGLTDAPITAIYPQELVCSVQHDQDGAAAFLIQTMTQMILDGARGLVDEQIIAGEQPILEATAITGIIATSHPYLDDEFNIVFDQDQQVQAELLTLIPLTAPEIDRANRDGVDALFEHLETTDHDLLDVTRSTS